MGNAIKFVKFKLRYELSRLRESCRENSQYHSCLLLFTPCRGSSAPRSKIDPSKPEASAKADLIQEISDFINARIYIADNLIVESAVTKVTTCRTVSSPPDSLAFFHNLIPALSQVVDGDVILTFAYSHVVAATLLEAAKRRKEFRVVVVDARPENEGRQMLQVGRGEA